VRKKKLILVSRSSALALQQSEWVQSELQRLHSGLQVDIMTLQTKGDRDTSKPLPEIGGKGLFTQELEESLLAGLADLAVHSLKDLPTSLPAGLVLGAIPEREDPRDALVSRNGETLDRLPRGALIGTSSTRRAAQLLAYRCDLRTASIRGNLDTRLRKLDEKQFDAIVLAAAGLRRMGWKDRISEYIDEKILRPAVGQGALGIEIRANDQEVSTLVAAMEDSTARIGATIERALLEALGGGCQIPIACSNNVQPNSISIHARVLSPDGSRLIESSGNESDVSIVGAARLGKKVAGQLLDQGAAQILAQSS
jgi:hydroxymethylbilane synthase